MSQTKPKQHKLFTIRNFWKYRDVVDVFYNKYVPAEG